MTNRSKAALCFLLGIIYFFIFAYDIENDRDISTWIWLLNSQISFLASLRFFIKNDNQEKK
jgi:hypothetical protein